MKPCQIGLQTRRPVFLGLLLSVLLIVALAIALLTRHTMYGPVHTTATLHSTFNTSKMVDRGNTLNLLDIAKFNTTLGCWHLRQDPVGLQASMHVSAEANFAPGARWEEVQKAVQLTQASNHGIHYVLVTNQLSMLHLLEETPTFNSVHYDVWYCPEVLYGTPIRIGNLYKGHKFAVSIDNWLPTFERRCLFATSKHQIVYVVQRNESHQLTGQDVSCTHYRAMGSADGILYGYIPDEVAQYMRWAAGTPPCMTDNDWLP